MKRAGVAQAYRVGNGSPCAPATLLTGRASISMDAVLPHHGRTEGAG